MGAGAEQRAVAQVGGGAAHGQPGEPSRFGDARQQRGPQRQAVHPAGQHLAQQDEQVAGGAPAAQLHVSLAAVRVQVCGRGGLQRWIAERQERGHDLRARREGS